MKPLYALLITLLVSFSSVCQAAKTSRPSRKAYAINWLDDQHVIVGYNGCIAVSNTETQEVNSKLTIPGLTVTRIVTLPDGTIIFGTNKGRIEQWDKDRRRHTLIADLKQPIVGLSVGAKFTATLVAATPQTFRVWKFMKVWTPVRIQTPELVRGTIQCVDIRPAGDLVAIGADRQLVHLYNVTDLKCKPKADLNAMNASLASLAFAPDGKTFALSGREDYALIVDEPDATNPSSSRFPCDAPVTAVGFSPNGELLACGTQKGYIALWTPKGDRLAVIESYLSAEKRELTVAPPIKQLVFSPDSSRVFYIDSQGVTAMGSVQRATPIPIPTVTAMN